LLPNCFHYIEPFGGSFSVVLNREPSAIETVNDIHSEIVNFFFVLREQPEELIRLLSFTPFSREEYNLSWNTENDSTIERARKFYVRIRQSFGSMGIQSRNKGWSYAKNTSRCNISESVNRWMKGVEKLEEIVNRLRMIQIENRSFEEIIPVFNQNKSNLIYCDPPYDFGLRSGNNDYLHDFKESDHLKLCELLHNSNCMVAISGYDSDLMNNLYSDFYKTAAPKHFNNISHKESQEILWTNYDPKTLYNYSLFN
jgi:DNA adenine methylase